MLTIRRCPTVVSNYQETLDQTTGCGHNCLGACCIHGAKLPVYSFVKFPSAKGLGLDFYGESDSSQVQEFDAQHDPVQGPALPFLNTLILAQWEDRLSRGLFRYDVTACETKVLPGEFGFIAQLNEGRHLKKRPTEFCVDKVLQPFDLKKFNFTKVGQEELLFCFEESEDKGSNYNEMVFMKDSPNVVIINSNRVWACAFGS
ncbi:hypothetical protein O6H91_04G118600 [Diphasiastrum complanatum]|uniref:Uncharacterized protein n=1 Tax=Diphasiastrum complanatum TaxID=34168 RepID=A0ACC2E1D6_DIPCM|nr:hypothetical protein O6H91_04G118600 [Diphasiastrum complanatum]